MPIIPAAEHTPAIPKELFDPAVASAEEVAQVLAPKSDASLLSEYKVKFIEGALEAKALIFGEFTLKSGRSVPCPFYLHWELKRQKGSKEEERGKEEQKRRS